MLRRLASPLRPASQATAHFSVADCLNRTAWRRGLTRANPGPAATESTRPLHVLLVEDDAPTAELLVIRLESLGCQVHHVGTVNDAITGARDGAFDLVVLDLMLDIRLGGFTVLEALRAAPATATVPIVLHSIYHDSVTGAPTQLALADGWLPKPLNVAALRELVDGLRELATASPV